MENYIQVVEDKLDKFLFIKNTPYQELLSFYGLLVLTVGVNCTQEHIHDAWSFWQNKTESGHRSLKPFQELTRDVQELDEKYRQAVVEVVKGNSR